MKKDPTPSEPTAADVFAMRFAEWAATNYWFEYREKYWSYTGNESDKRTTEELLKEFKALKKF